MVRYIALDHLTWNDPNEIWLLKSMETFVHNKKSVSTKVTKDFLLFRVM